MDILRELVRNIALIVILASFLEMFLPGGSMRSFVRVIMGLFMIVTVLNPMLQFIREDFTFPAFTWSAVAGDTRGILAKGEALARQNRQLALIEYKQRLAQQVKAVAEMKGGLTVYDVALELVGEDSGQPTGEIKKISILARPGREKGTSPREGWVEPISPVNIGPEEATRGKGEGSEEEHLDSRVKNKLAETLANFYNLSPGQVRITEN